MRFPDAYKDRNSFLPVWKSYSWLALGEGVPHNITKMRPEDEPAKGPSKGEQSTVRPREKTRNPDMKVERSIQMTAHTEGP